MNKVLALLSGGLDSTALVSKVVVDYDDVETVSINYGQRHRRELEAARDVARFYGLRHDVVDLSVLRPFLSGSALTDEVAVPDGHYAEQSMRATVVPNRNMIMLSVAVGIAVARQLDTVAIAVHTGDHFIYPDCRPAFIDAASAAALLGTDTFGPKGMGIQIIAPFIAMTKAEIVTLGELYGAPFPLSWSCYKGGAKACGRCGTCVERLEAFDRAGVVDPIEYEDRAFYLTAEQPWSEAELREAYGK